MMQNLPRRTIFAFCCVGLMQLSFTIAAPAVCLTAIAADLHMDYFQKGLFVASVPLGLAIAILASGVLADRWGFRALLVCGSAMQVCGFGLLSIADTQALAIAGGFIMGLGSGMADALLTPMVNALYPQRRTTATNLLHSFFPLGIILTILGIMGVFAVGMTWRGACVSLAIASVPYGVAMLFLPLPAQSHEGTQRLKARVVIRRPEFMLLLAAIFMAGITELGPSSWLPDFVNQIAGSGQNQGALGLMFFAISMAAGRFTTSALVRRLGPKCVLVCSGAICVASLLLAANADKIMTIVWLSILGFGVASMWPTILACAGNRFPQGGASMYSLLSAMGNLGGTAGPITIGSLADYSNIRVAMAVLAAAPLALIVITLLMLRTKGK